MDNTNTDQNFNLLLKKTCKLYWSVPVQYFTTVIIVYLYGDGKEQWLMKIYYFGNLITFLKLTAFNNLVWLFCFFFLHIGHCQSLHVCYIQRIVAKLTNKFQSIADKAKETRYVKLKLTVLPMYTLNLR